MSIVGVSRWSLVLSLGVLVALVSALGAPQVAWAESLSGVVRDARTGEPIAGAWVQVQAQAGETHSEASGRFTLQGGAPGVRVTAAARGYFTAGADWPADGELVFALDPVINHPDKPVDLIDPSACQGCHKSQVDEWKTSGMAHAGNNQWVEDLYLGTATPKGDQGFVYVRDSVHAARDPASDCAACHQPELWMNTPFVPYLPASARDPAAERGVSCITCHTMAQVDESRPSFPGIYPGVVEMTRGSVVRYGVLGDVDYHATGRMRASYQPQLGAAVCATCHQDSNDPSGQKTFDGPISEPTWLEWLNSPYGDPNDPRYQTCMDCHSSPTGAPSASSLQVTVPRAAGAIRSHDFPGTTPEFLEKALDLRVSTSVQDGVLQVHVELENTGTGHHVPTGVTIRNVLLLVEVEDADGALTYLGQELVGPLGGEGDPAEGYFASLPGKLYAKVNRAEDGSRAVLFTEAVDIPDDTRLAALQVDRIDFPFQLGTAEVVSVRARVIYRRAWRKLIDAKGWTHDGRGRELADLKPPHFGHLMAEKAFEVQVNAPGEPDDAPPATPASQPGCGCQATPSGIAGAAPQALLYLIIGGAILRAGRRRPKNTRHSGV